MNLDSYPILKTFQYSLNNQFPYFSSVIEKQYELFGDEWLKLFEKELKLFFGEDTSSLDSAVTGYGKFCLDSMKLQVKFQKTKTYDNKTYDDAAAEVYQNKNYMFSLYLPGILLSHYLWKHHYIQHMFFIKNFIPLIQKNGGAMFFDVGVGTGFYSKEMLTRSLLKGKGFDMSPHSLDHTLQMLQAHQVEHRYECCVRDIINDPVVEQADYLINIEVLEHLEDPQLFLNHLVKMLKSGGYGFISAAINAPNADHIYLYRNDDEVAVQLKKAGFTIIDRTVDEAYSPRKSGEIVPVNVVFIVSKI